MGSRFTSPAADVRDMPEVLLSGHEPDARVSRQELSICFLCYTVGANDPQCKMNLYYALALLVSTAVSATIVVITWRRRAAPGASGLALLTLSFTVWAFTYAIRWISASEPAQYFWLNATYFGVVTTPFFFTIFALQFTNRTHWLTRRNLILLSIEPLLTLVLLWTDNWHGLFYGGLRSTGAILNGGPWFWFNLIYSYVLNFMMLGLFIQAYWRASHLYRRQAGLVLVGVLIPFLGNMLSLGGFNPFPDLDLTPIMFIISGLVYAYGLFSNQLMDVLPIARDKLMEDMRDGLIVLDVQNRIVDINPAAQEMSGISSGWIGKPAQTAFAAWADLGDIYSATVETRMEIRISQTPPRDVEIRLSPLFNARKNLNGRLILLQDITVRKQAEETIRSYAADLERRVEERTAELVAANRAKDAFLAAASHELRTPLSAIMGSSGILLEGLRGPLNQKQAESIQVIETSAARLLSLVNDIMDVAILETGKIDLYPATVRVEDICQASLRLGNEAAARKSQTVTYVPAIGDPVIKTDQKRLNQILNNLLSNAVKFTPVGGKITLQVETDEVNHLIQFSISDSGIGILPQDMEKLFKPFVQIDNKLSRQYEGTGLGLAITKKLVDLLGGNIQVKTEAGQGSCFIITLPEDFQS